MVPFKESETGLYCVSSITLQSPCQDAAHELLAASPEQCLGGAAAAYRSSTSQEKGTAHCRGDPPSPLPVLSEREIYQPLYYPSPRVKL